MKLKCAACGASASLDVMITHDGARESLVIAFEMPAPIGKLLVQYLALHRPKERDLSFDRVATLLGPLLLMIQAGQIEHKKKTWPAPLGAWLAAMEQTLIQRDKLTLPLKGHGYLLSIIAGMGEKAAAEAETRREDQRQNSDRPHRSGPSTVDISSHATGDTNPGTQKVSILTLPKEQRLAFASTQFQGLPRTRTKSREQQLRELEEAQKKGES